MTTAKCRSCGAEIVWAQTSSGARMPMDAEPISTRGLFELVGESVVVAHASVPREFYRSHFATCPNAAEHRRS